MKGQTLLGVIMWATGISVTIGGLAFGITNTKFSHVGDKIEVHTENIATLKAESREYRNDIEEIKVELKEIKNLLEKIGEKNGIRQTVLATSSPVI